MVSHYRLIPTHDLFIEDVIHIAVLVMYIIIIIMMMERSVKFLLLTQQRMWHMVSQRDRIL